MTDQQLGSHDIGSNLGKADAVPLSRENALVLVDEFEALFTRGHGEHTDPRARATAGRILSNLARAPGPPDEIATVLQRILAWTELLFADQQDAVPENIKPSLRRSLGDLRQLIDAKG